MSSRRQLFIQYIREWCADPSHGYNQAARDGDPDVDCSSFMYIAARRAGYAIPAYNGSTWSMLSDFTAAGWHALEFDGNLWDCEPGCIALNVSSHTEAFVDAGRFGGAHIDENGDVTGGTPGDQTGNEVSECAAYVFSGGWDYILIPPDDCEDGVPAEPAIALPLPFYRLWTHEEEWLDWMNGLIDDGGSNDNYAGIPGHWAYDIEFQEGSLGPAGYWRLILADGRMLGKNECNADHKSHIVGICVEYDTPDPESTGYYKASYQAHWLGSSPSWGKWELDNEDGGAGKDCESPIDMFRCTIVPA